jgi:hypothetical protein
MEECSKKYEQFFKAVLISFHVVCLVVGPVALSSACGSSLFWISSKDVSTKDNNTMETLLPIATSVSLGGTR